MKLNNRALFTFLFTVAALSGCASSTNKAIDAKVAGETDVKNRKDLQTEADKLIDQDTSLTADQKKQLEILRTQVSTKLSELSNQSLKLRSVLVEEVLSPNYSIDEMNQIKKRLKNVEDNRLTVMFDGVDKANTILGREAHRHAGMMRNILEDRGASRE